MGPKKPSDQNSKALTLEDLNNTMMSVLESIQFQSTKFDTILETQTKFQSTLESAMAEVGALKAKCVALESTNIQLSTKIYEMEQQLLSNSLELVGVPEDKGLEEAVSSVLDCINCSAYKPLKMFRRKGKLSHIVVVDFSTKQIRDLVIEKKKHVGKVKIADKEIYIRELLTPYTKELLWLCNSMKVNLKYKYVWTKNGTVLMKKDDSSTSKVLYIKSKADIPSV